jgi:hypothetical protein
VSDDYSDMSAPDFLAALHALSPADMFAQLFVHAIYGGPTTACSGPLGTADAPSPEYAAMVEMTNGASGLICEDDWSAVFSAISTAVVTGSKLPCELEIPEPTDGVTLDTGKVNVTFAPGSGPAQTLPKVASQAACGDDGGWYYDNDADPTRIILCDGICATAEADPDGKLSITVGCGTITVD